MARQYAHKRLFYTCEGHRFTFECHAENTRDGFKHVAVLYKEDNPWYTAQASVNYLNRTWESFEYQTVCTRLAMQLGGEIIERDLQAWKDQNGYKRMTANRSKQWEAQPTSANAQVYVTLTWAIRCMPHPWSDCVGNREREIIENLGNVTLIERTPEHCIYRLYSEDGTRFCDFDENTRRFVG